MNTLLNSYILTALWFNILVKNTLGIETYGYLVVHQVLILQKYFL